MKIFVINLDRDVERLLAFQNRLDDLGLSYERVSAVDGRSLPEDVKRVSVNHLRWRLVMGRGVHDGEIGCAFSHQHVFQKMVELPIDLACVFEDDVVLDDALVERLEEVRRYVDVQRPQVVLLSNHTDCCCEEHAVLPTKSDLYAEAYVLTRPAAEAMLRANSPFAAPFDHWGRWVKLGLIELYHAFPTVARQNWSGDYASNVGQIGYRARRRALVMGAVRHIGYWLDDALCWFEKRRGR